MKRSLIPFLCSALLGCSAVAMAPTDSLARSARATSHRSTASCIKQHHHSVDTSGTNPVIRLGTSGGNIRPFSIAVLPDGKVVSNGPVTVHNVNLTDPKNTLNGLLAFADVEGFWTLKSNITCAIVPDVASRFVQLHTSNGDRTITSAGGCNAHFNQLFSTLMNVTGAAFGGS